MEDEIENNVKRIRVRPYLYYEGPRGRRDVDDLLRAHDAQRDRARFLQSILDDRELLHKHCGWYRAQREALADALRDAAEQRARVEDLETAINGYIDGVHGSHYVAFTSITSLHKAVNREIDG